MATFSYYSPTIRETGILPDDLLEMLHEEDRSPDNPVVCDCLLYTSPSPRDTR